MKGFTPKRLDLLAARRQIDSLRAWLDDRAEFPEKDVRDHLATMPDLALAIGGSVCSALPSHYAFEYEITDFRADLVVVSKPHRRSVFIEFESGEKSSIFKQTRGSIRHRDWSGRLEHGLGQLIDWAWARDDQKGTVAQKNVFGSDPWAESYLLICGRDRHLDETERNRLRWRFVHTMIGAARIVHWTWDDVPALTAAFVDALTPLPDAPSEGVPEGASNDVD